MAKNPKPQAKSFEQQVADALKPGGTGMGAGENSPFRLSAGPDAKHTGPAGHQRGKGPGKFGQNKPGASAPRRTSG